MTAYEQGQKAFENGEFMEDNPFPVDSHAWDAWNNGWYDADFAVYMLSEGVSLL